MGYPWMFSNVEFQTKDFKIKQIIVNVLYNIRNLSSLVYSNSNIRSLPCKGCGLCVHIIATNYSRFSLMYIQGNPNV